MSTHAQLQTRATPVASQLPARPGLLQHACACGGAAGLSGECEECRAQRMVARAPLVQAKLTVSQPGDRYEQEADRVADQVLRMPAPRPDEDERVQTKPLAATITPLPGQRPGYRTRTSADERGWLARAPLVSALTTSFNEPRRVPAVQRACAACAPDDERVQRQAATITPLPGQRPGYRTRTSADERGWLTRAPDVSALTTPFNEPLRVPAVQRACAACAPDDERVQRQAEADEQDDELVQHQPEDADDEQVQAKPEPSALPMVTPNLAGRIQALRGGGQPLPASERAFFEPRFGHDFGGVRVHTGSAAGQLARAVQARAFTLGRDVVFGAGQYAPGSHAGRQLLAHELTHVVQQRMERSISRLNKQTAFVRRIQGRAQDNIIQRAPRPSCAVHMGQIGNAPVCSEPPKPNVVGNRVGAQIERMFREESPSNHKTQVPIPAAPKSTVHSDRGSLIPASIPSVGKVDLVKIISRDENTIRIQIGEVKPMKWTWLAAGLLELEYYKQKIEEAQDECIRYKTEFVEGLERRLTKLPAAEAKQKRTLALSEASKLLASHMFCTKLDAIGKKVTLASPFGLTWRSHSFSMNLGNRSRRVLAMTCDDGVVGYRCLEKSEKSDKKTRKKHDKDKQRKPRRPKSATQAKKVTRATEKPSRGAARAIEKAIEQELRKKAVTKVARKAIAKTIAKVAARVALKAIPIVGWVLLAIDIAEAAYGIYNFTKYGPSVGEGDKSGSKRGTSGESQATGTSEIEGKETVESNPQTKNRGLAEDKGETKDKGSSEKGETKDKGSSESSDVAVDEELSRLGIFDTPEAATAFAEALPLSKKLLNGLKQSTPEQQRLLELLLTNIRESGRLSVNEQFFLHLLQISSKLSAEELEKLESRLVPISSESSDDVLKRVEQNLDSIRQGANTSDADAKKQNVEQKGARTKGTGKSTSQKSSGAQKHRSEALANQSKLNQTGVVRAQKPPLESDRTNKGVFRYRILAGLHPAGQYVSGQSYSCNLLIKEATNTFEVSGVKITYMGRTDTEQIIKGQTYLTTQFKVYITEDFWVEKYKFYGRSGHDDAGVAQLTDYDFGRRPKK